MDAPSAGVRGSGSTAQAGFQPPLAPSAGCLCTANDKRNSGWQALHPLLENTSLTHLFPLLQEAMRTKTSSATWD